MRIFALIFSFFFSFSSFADYVADQQNQDSYRYSRDENSNQNSINYDNNYPQNNYRDSNNSSGDLDASRNRQNNNNYDNSNFYPNSNNSGNPAGTSSRGRFCPYFNNGGVTLDFYNCLGTSSFAVRVLLHCAKVRYNSILVDLKEHKFQRFGKVNNFYEKTIKGAVPYIEYGNFRLSEGAAILSYISDKCQMFNGNGDGRYKIIETINFVATDIYRNVTPVFGNYINRNAKEFFLQKAKEKLELLDKILGDRDFFVQNQLTIADFYVLSILLIIKASPIDLASFVNLNRFYNSMQQEACVRDAFRQEIEENKKMNSSNQQE